MALLEELLKFSKTHAQSVVVGLVAVIAVGTVGGGIWIHNLQSMLEIKDTLHKQELALATEDAKAELHRLEEHIDDLDEKVNQQQTFLEDTSSKLRHLVNQKCSASVNHEIELIADDLHRSKDELGGGVRRTFRADERAMSSLTGSSGRPMARRSPLSSVVILIVFVISVICITWIGVRFYKRNRRRPT